MLINSRLYLLSLMCLFMGACIDDASISREADGGEESESEVMTLDDTDEESDTRDMNADTVEAGTVEAGTVEAGTVEAGTIEAGTIEAGTIEAGTIDAGAEAGADAGADAGAEILLPTEDEDNDGVINSDDNCPRDANNSQRDQDDDGRGDACDNCAETPNFDQADDDMDGVGDACEALVDSDGDGVTDLEDNCPTISNPPQRDRDDDGVGNACDNCVETPNNDQADTDRDGVGDLCDEAETPVMIELSWESAEVDFDLHLINARGEFFSQSDDCWSSNRSPDWATPGLAGDAPRNGETREQIMIDAPRSEWHVIGVDLYTQRDEVTSVASVSLTCRGEVTMVGPHEMTSLANRQRTLWEALRFNPETCEVELLDVDRDVTCAGDRAISCSCEDCEVGVCIECPEGAECNTVTGECNDPCADIECDSGLLCNSENGVCESSQCAPCDTADDCPGGSYCITYPGQSSSSCALACERGDDCAEGDECVQIFLNREVVGVCADDNACEIPICDSVSCDTDTVCDPTDGACVECYDSDQCDEGFACLERACVEIEGEDRQVSGWEDGNTLPSCNQCTADEECRDFPLVPAFCALSCNEALVCPDGMFCCTTFAGFGVESTQICVDERNSASGTLCR